MGSKSGRHAKLNLRAKQHLSQLLTLAFLISLVSVPVFSERSVAATAGSGLCTQQLASSSGVEVTKSGNDCIIKFTATGSNSWIVPTGVTSVRTLIVGGGGGGGAWVGGGGGGGGFRDLSSIPVTPTNSVAINVGAGGSPADSVNGLYNSVVGTNGGDSSFGNLTASGGGKGASHWPNAAWDSTVVRATSGGSGGGGTGDYNNDSSTWRLLRAGAVGNTPNTSPAQGNSGGSGYLGAAWVSGGGGGAGAAGGSGTLTSGGAGGVGAISDITGSSVYYAGGGGGIVYNSTTGGGAGGAGGGGSGTPNGTGASGTANTGGGGGGGGTNGSTSRGGYGGSGVVIVRYTIATASSGSGLCSQTYSSVGTGTLTATQANGYCYLALRNTGALNSQTTFNLSKPSGVSSIEYLVIAGGGGGAVRHGGGGGAGGLLKGTLSVSSLTTITATVGAGGAGGVPPSGANYGPGTSGQDSSLESLVAKGGGAGNTGGASTDRGSSGGSGGGALGVNAGGTGTSGQGNNGAGGIGGVSPYSAGGGGGAGAAGTAGSGSNGGAGGAGAIWDSSFTSTIAQNLGWPSNSAQFSGNQVLFAGGGGGGSAGGTGGAGSAGGGAGSGSTNGFSASAGSGSGGGGSGCCYLNPAGGDGGSGIVLIRYQVTFNVTYNSNGGTLVSAGTFDLGGSIASSPTAPTRAGYSFAGWSATLGGSSISFPYTPGASSDITLYALWTRSSQTVDNSLTFDGSTNQDAKATGVSVIPATGDFTVEAWVKPSSGSQLYGMVLSQGSSVTGESFYINRVSNGTANQDQIFYRRPGANYQSCQIPAPADQWTHVAVSFSGLNSTCYINGSLGSSFTATSWTAISSGDFLLGNWVEYPSLADYRWTGSIDEVRIYTASRAEAQINADLKTYGPTNATNLTAYYDFNEGVGATINNLVSNASSSTNLTISGSPTWSNLAKTSTSGNRTVVTFERSYLNSSGGWSTPTNVSSAQVLIVAGGGGGGDSKSQDPSRATGGGGGAGGYFTNSAVPLSGTISIGVGVGGAGALTTSSRAVNGGDSWLGTLKVGGGGGGNSYGFTTALAASAGNGGSDYVVGGNGGGGRSKQNTSNASMNGGSAGVYALSGISFGGTTFTGSAGGAGGSGGGDFGSGGLGGSISAINRTSSISGTSIEYAKRSDYRPWGHASNTQGTKTFGSGGSTNYMYGSAESAPNIYGGDGAQGVVIVSWQSTFNVTYNSKGGTSVTSGTFNLGGSISSEPNAPTRSGFTFAGWSATDGGSRLTFPYTPSVSTDITLYARWTADTYTITYDSNGGNLISNDSYIGGGTAITLPTPTRTGYTFNGWFESASFTGSALTSPYTPTQTRTVYANWTADTYTITYDSNGGSSISNGSYTVGGTAITLPTPTRTGYTFNGWFESASFTGSALTSPYTPTQTRTLYARWTADTYTITYDSNGGNLISSDSYIGGGTAITLPTPTRTGYTFNGWYESSSFTGSALTSPYTPTQTRTIYAKWSANSNTVTFNSNYGTPTTSTQLIPSGTATALSANSFTRTGYTFTGWNTLSDGTGTSYSNSQSVTIYAPFTLYAQWSEVNYTVTYDRNGATGSPEKSSEVYGISSGALVLPTIGSMTKSGYRFDGWSESSGGSKLSSPYTPTSTRTLYARWIAASYTITYDTNGATSGAPSVTSDSYTTGAGVISFATQNTLIRTGYTFNGWSTTRNETNTKVSNLTNYTISAPVILFALWTADNYSVTYTNQNATNGVVPTDTTIYNIGNSAVIKANIGSLVRTGYSFGGWTINGDSSGNVYQSGDTYTFASSSVTFNPRWIANTYNITYNANGATGTPARTSDTYTTGNSAIQLPGRGTMVKTGYTFTGWSSSATGIGQSSATTTSDLTLYAIWDLNRYTVAFNRGMIESISLSGSHVATFPTSTEADYNTTITLGSSPTDVSANASVNSNLYQFFGWSDGNTIYNPGQNYVMGASAPTFTAQWIRLFEVRYALNGGSGIVDVDSECTQAGNTCLANQSISLSAAPTRPGYTFSGWKDQSENLFSAGATTTVTNTSFVYYAQWTPVNYTVSFNSVGGSNSPVTQTKNIGQTVTLPDPGTRTGYDFSGWTLGGVTYGVGTTFTVGTSNASFTAIWNAKRFNVSYDWNGGIGTPTSAEIYTYGNAAITLPRGSSHTKDGYVFAGWKDQDGNSIGLTHTPSQDTRYVAQWIDGSYTINYNSLGGNLAQPTVTVARNSAITLPKPTRANFTFDGWYEDSNVTVLYGQAATAVTPSASKTLYAKWVQDSLSGINPAHLNSLTTITTQTGNSSSWTGSHSLSGTGATLSIPADALPNGTVVKVSFVEDLSRPKNLINNTYAYYTSVVLHWQLGTGVDATVPTAAAGKPLVLTLTNPDIRSGAKIYKIIRGEAREVATATQDGQVTISVFEDPEIVVAATAPSAPLSVTAIGNLNSQSTVSWTAPTSSGGAEVTSYTVTSNPGNKTCTATGTTSCTVSGLTNNNSYSFTVVANNAVGSSIASSASNSVIPRLVPTFAASFDSKGGSSVSGILFNNTDGIDEPTAPTRAGYTFGGWLAQDGVVSSKVTFPYTPNLNSDITLFAHWIANAISNPLPENNASAGGNLTANNPISSVNTSNESTNASNGITKPLINIPEKPSLYSPPQTQFAELKNAPYPTNGLNVPMVGEVITLINRQPTAVKVTASEVNTLIEIGNSISMTLTSKSNEGYPIAPSASGAISVVKGAFVDATGVGFKPGSPIEAWLFSKPIRLGDGVASTDGTFENKFSIGNDIPLGKHTIVLNGISSKNELVTVALGVQVLDKAPVTPNVSPEIVKTPSPLTQVLESISAGLFIMIIFSLLWLLIRRRRREEAN